MALAVVLLIGLWFQAEDPHLGLSREYFPIDAIEAIPADVRQGRVFNAFHWGGYLEYCCPDVPVFIDGRTDYFGEELTRQYAETVRGGPEWTEVFRDYEIDWVLIEPESGLSQVLIASTAWEEIHRDDTAIVFSHRQSASLATLSHVSTEQPAT